MENGMGLTHVLFVPNWSHAYKIDGGFLNPLPTVIHRTVVRSNNFQLVLRIVAVADALDRRVNGITLIIAGQEDTHGRFVRVVFLNADAGVSDTHNSTD